MDAKDKTLAIINSARESLADLPRSREASIVATKLDEAALWLGKAGQPEAIEFVGSGDVLLAQVRHGRLRVELVEDLAADCTMLIDGHTPISIRVNKPHDRSLAQEATEVLGGLYLSRSRSLDGHALGVVTRQSSLATPAGEAPSKDQGTWVKRPWTA